MTGPRLGIDFGTSTTVAVLRRSDGRVQQLLFDGTPLLSSAVLLGTDGRLYTGRDAAHLARSAPERFEPNPKRRIDDSNVLLADAEVDVGDLVTAVLNRVCAEAARVAGPVRDVTLTHPANWGGGRRAVLTDAARRLGFDTVELVAEPLAAATFFAASHGAGLPVGSFLLVYDLGAGTCDVTLLRRQVDGFVAVASDGLNDLGGLDVDAAVVEHLQGAYGRLWTDVETRRRLWDDARSAKEMLSRASHTVIMLPALGKEVPLGREQFEGLARPVLRPSIALTRALLANAGVRPADVGGLFLVGGSSRMPLVATMLHDALGIAPTVAEQPELVVAEGALRMRPTPTAVPTPAPATPALPTNAAPADRLAAATAGRGIAGAPPVHVKKPSKRRRLAATAIGLVVLAGVTIAGYAVLHGTGEASGSSGPSVAPARYQLAKAPDNLCDLVDLTALHGVYETQDQPSTPSRNLTGELSNTSCSSTRVHNKGAFIAQIIVAVGVFATTDTATQNYQVTVNDVAKVNDNPVAVPGLGDESVVFGAKDAPEKLRTDLTLMVGVRVSNLTWVVRLTVTRNDHAGWTDPQRQDLRDRLLTVTRTSLPKVSAALT